VEVEMTEDEFRRAAFGFGSRMPSVERQLVALIMARVALNFDRHGPLEERLDQRVLAEMQLDDVADQIVRSAVATLRARKSARGWFTRWLGWLAG
jgi:hypothetical protein